MLRNSPIYIDELDQLWHGMRTQSSLLRVESGQETTTSSGCLLSRRPNYI